MSYKSATENLTVLALCFSLALIFRKISSVDYDDREVDCWSSYWVTLGLPIHIWVALE